MVYVTFFFATNYTNYTNYFFIILKFVIIRVISGKFYNFKSRSAASINVSSSLAKQKRIRFKSV